MRRSSRSSRYEVGSAEKLVYPHHLNNDAVTDSETLLRVPSDQSVHSLIKLVIVAWDFRDGDESLNEKIDQLDREAISPNGDDERIEGLAQVLFHEKHLLPVE